MKSGFGLNDLPSYQCDPWSGDKQFMGLGFSEKCVKEKMHVTNPLTYVGLEALFGAT